MQRDTYGPAIHKAHTRSLQHADRGLNTPMAVLDGSPRRVTASKEAHRIS